MFSIGIPTINRYDLLAPSLERYVKDFPCIDIHIVDNGNQHIIPGHKNITVHLMPENIGVASSWNLLLKTIFKKNNIAVLLNDDIYWGRTRTQVLQHFKWLFTMNETGFAVSNKSWCVFAIHKKTVERVGYFDEAFFPAYFEDNDYSDRMMDEGIITSHDPFFDPQVFRSSMSLEKDKAINNNFMKNKQYYEAKRAARTA